MNSKNIDDMLKVKRTYSTLSDVNKGFISKTSDLKY